MRTTACVRFLILICGWIIVIPSLSSHSAETIERTVRGTVVATNIASDPQTIVVNVLLPNKQELTVGARVPTDIKITRGTHPTQLAEVKTGETADVTYRKGPDGLVAQSIHVR